jgi:hypothetical protein
MSCRPQSVEKTYGYRVAPLIGTISGLPSQTSLLQWTQQNLYACGSREVRPTDGQMTAAVFAIRLLGLKPFLRGGREFHVNFISSTGQASWLMGAKLVKVWCGRAKTPLSLWSAWSG